MNGYFIIKSTIPCFVCNPNDSVDHIYADKQCSFDLSLFKLYTEIPYLNGLANKGDRFSIAFKTSRDRERERENRPKADDGENAIIWIHDKKQLIYNTTNYIRFHSCNLLILSCFLYVYFHFVGGIGLIWSLLWFFIVFESPAVHPRISPEERKEIEDAIGNTTSKKRPSYVPWMSIITSPCVWAIILTHATSVFCYFTIVNQLPTYMKYILHFDIKSVS